jgi:hypothetical protein
MRRSFTNRASSSASRTTLCNGSCAVTVMIKPAVNANRQPVGA